MPPISTLRGFDMILNALNCLRSFIEREEGVTAIEYGLIAALFSFVIITAVSLGFPWSSLE